MQEKPFFPKLAGTLCAGTAVGTSVCPSYEKIAFGEGLGDQEILHGQMRVGVAQHYNCRAVIRGFLTGRSAKIKWVLLQHLIRKGPLILSSPFGVVRAGGRAAPTLCHHIKVPLVKGLTFLSCSSALGSMDGQGGNLTP